MAKKIITISREFGSGGRFIGEEVAKKVPYLLDASITNDNLDFDATWYDDNDTLIYIIGNNAVNYIAKYKQYLLTLNYVTSDNVTYTNNVDNLKIVVGNTKDDFLHISLINI